MAGSIVVGATMGLHSAYKMYRYNDLSVRNWTQYAMGLFTAVAGSEMGKRIFLAPAPHHARAPTEQFSVDAPHTRDLIGYTLTADQYRAFEPAEEPAVLVGWRRNGGVVIALVDDLLSRPPHYIVWSAPLGILYRADKADIFCIRGVTVLAAPPPVIQEPPPPIDPPPVRIQNLPESVAERQYRPFTDAEEPRRFTWVGVVNQGSMQDLMLAAGYDPFLVWDGNQFRTHQKRDLYVIEGVTLFSDRYENMLHRQAAQLAFMMATHPRLGADSTFGGPMPDDVGRLIAERGGVADRAPA